MKNKYLNNFKEKTKEELLHIIENPKNYNEAAVAAAHELLRKKTATFTEYQELTNGNTELSNATHGDDEGNILLTILKWIAIILFFPLSLVVVGYYKNKKAKKAYYANNRPMSER